MRTPYEAHLRTHVVTKFVRKSYEMEFEINEDKIFSGNAWNGSEVTLEVFIPFTLQPQKGSCFVTANSYPSRGCVTLIQH